MPAVRAGPQIQIASFCAPAPERRIFPEKPGDCAYAFGAERDLSRLPVDFRKDRISSRAEFRRVQLTYSKTVGEPDRMKSVQIDVPRFIEA